MKTLHQPLDIEPAEAAEDGLKPQLATIDEHAKEDLSPVVLEALYPSDYAEVEDAVQAETLARHAAASPRHRRVVLVPAEAMKEQL